MWRHERCEIEKEVLYDTRALMHGVALGMFAFMEERM